MNSWLHRVIKDPQPDPTKPYHVMAANGMRLASFKTQAMAESYRNSILVQIALDVREEFRDRRIATEEETLP